MLRRSARLGLLITALSVLAVSAPAHALLTYTAFSGSLAAQADFSVTGSTLHVKLWNTSTNDVLVPAEILTGVFFNLSGPTLTPTSALLGSSTVWFGSSGGGNVGGEWAYASGLSGAPGSATKGISSAGLGLFGNPNFNGPQLDSPLAVDGLGYGLTSAGDNTATGNSAVTGGFALIQNAVDFTLDGSAPFAESDISNVWFQYGTALTEPALPGTPGTPPIPEPASLTLLGLGLIGLGPRFIRRKSSR